MSINQSSQINFEEVTGAANVAINPEGVGNASSYGAAWTDFNNDSSPDFWINNHNIKPRSLRNLYINQGDGTFTDIAPEVLPEIKGDPHGAAWADFDNDGDQDLIQISAGEGTGAGGGTAFPPISTPNFLFVNDEGVLEDRAPELGLSYVSAVAQTPIWLDFDNDGLLDLFHTSIQRPDGLFPSTIFRQTDEGFEDVGATMLPSEVQSVSHKYGILSDLTGDGSMELILPQWEPSSTSGIILDTSSTPFTDLTDTLLPDPKLFNYFTRDIASADFNNDLQPDLYLASGQEDTLLINTGQGLVDRSEEAGINSVSNQGAFSVVAGDFDNDMDVDVYTITRKESENRLYENQGDGSFIVVPNAGGAPISSVRNGDTVTTADYDMDGFLDFFIDSGTETARHLLFRNQGNDNNWLEIDLQGVKTNRDGIGAQVFLTVGGVTQMREQTGGVHKWSQNDQRIHFGLADNTQVDLLEIRWPSGVVQQLENVEANQLLQIVEEPEATNGVPIRIEAEDYAPGGQGISYFDNAAKNYGKAYRNDGVDIQPTEDAGGGFNVGWIREGEWLTYDLNLPQDGTYNLVARVATPYDDRSFSASIDDQTTTFEFDSTGGWQSWQDVVAEDLNLSAGSQQLRVDMLTDAFNLNYLELVPVNPEVEEPEATNGVPIRIEAEDYAPGGQGISYFDNAAKNYGKAYRNDGVDIQPTEDVGGGFNVGWIREGEWLTYDLNLPQDGTYDLVARVASPSPYDDRSFSVSIGDQTTKFEFDSTGSWQSWQDVVAEDLNLSAGSQQLRVDMLSEKFNLNYLELVPVSLETI